jgi:hypothetical protein
MFTCPSVPVALRFLQGCLSPAPTLPKEEQHWLEFAQNLARGPFIMWLANEVATDLIVHNPANHSIDTMIADVDSDDVGHLQHDAEEFLHQQYTQCDPTQERRITVFRHLIQRRLKFAK